MLTLFALNRSLTEEMPLRVAAKGFGNLRVEKALQLHHADLKAINSKAAPDKVAPTALSAVRIDGEHVHATLKPASWNVIRVNVAK
jgi:alpha-N-arabinofuranosidase